MFKTFLAISLIFPALLLAAEVSYDPTPLNQCVYSLMVSDNTDLGFDVPVCTETFDSNCSSLDGVLRQVYMHPSPFVMKYCYRKSPDAGKACSANSQCNISCDLESAIQNNTCKLIEKIEPQNPEEFWIYKAIYQCTSQKPGVCIQAPVFYPMDGTNESYEMNGDKLIKLVVPGPIS